MKIPKPTQGYTIDCEDGCVIPIASHTGPCMHGRKVEIPEINTDQMSLLLEVVMNADMKTFSQLEPSDKDTPAQQCVLSKGKKDVDYLVELGLLKNITEVHKEQVAKILEQSGNKYRIFEVTAMSRALFQAHVSPLVN